MNRKVREMKFEEYIQTNLDENAEDASADCIVNQVALTYFPFTSECPRTGRECEKEDCGQYFEGKCLHFERTRLIYQMSGQNRHIISHRLAEGRCYPYWRICIASYCADRVGISIESDNRTITQLVLKELQLIDRFNCSGERDAIKYFPEVFDSLPEIKKFLDFLSENTPKIMELMKKYFRCFRCKEIKTYITIFGRIGVCEECQEAITQEWINEREKKERT